MNTIQSFASATYQMLATLIISIATTVIEYIRRFLPPQAASVPFLDEGQPKLTPASHDTPQRPAPHPNSPIETPGPSRDLQLKLAHRRGAMAEYTRPKYEAREW